MLLKTKTMLAIQATPRKHGKVAAMLDAAVQQGKSCGYDTVVIDLYQKNIQYCTGCMACRLKGECVIQDDLPEIAALLTKSDLIVLAAPTWFANVPAVLKALFDRIAGLTMEEGPTGIPHGRFKKEQKYLLITACTTPFPFNYLAGQSSGCIRAMREVMHTCGMTMAGKVVLAGSKNKKQVPEKVLNKIQKIVRKSI